MVTSGTCSEHRTSARSRQAPAVVSQLWAVNFGRETHKPAGRELGVRVGLQDEPRLQPVRQPERGENEQQRRERIEEEVIARAVEPAERVARERHVALEQREPAAQRGEAEVDANLWGGRGEVEGRWRGGRGEVEGRHTPRGRAQSGWHRRTWRWLPPTPPPSAAVARSD